MKVPRASFFAPLNHLLSPTWILQIHSLPPDTVADTSWWRPPSSPSAVVEGEGLGAQTAAQQQQRWCQERVVTVNMGGVHSHTAPCSSRLPCMYVTNCATTMPRRPPRADPPNISTTSLPPLEPKSVPGLSRVRVVCLSYLCGPAARTCSTSCPSCQCPQTHPAGWLLTHGWRQNHPQTGSGLWG